MSGLSLTKNVAVWRMTVPDFKTFSKATVTQKVWGGGSETSAVLRPASPPLVSLRAPE